MQQTPRNNAVVVQVQKRGIRKPPAAAAPQVSNEPETEKRQEERAADPLVVAPPEPAPKGARKRATRQSEAEEFVYEVGSGLESTIQRKK